MVKNHMTKLVEYGYEDVTSFIEYVSLNFTSIKEGRIIHCYVEGK